MTSTTCRFALRTSAVLGVATAAALATAAPALAHVTAQPGTAEQGGYAVVNFRVPDESDTAGTIKLEVKLPTDTPFTSVRTTPIAGWTATLTKSPLNPPVKDDDGRPISEAVTSVVWTAAAGNKIPPGQYIDFPLSLGPMPKGVGTVTLPATQTYDNGDVVTWNEPTPADGSEPQHPAPTVKLTPADDADAAPVAAAAGGGTDTTARWLGGGGLLIGALGLGLGGGAVLRSRKKESAS